MRIHTRTEYVWDEGVGDYVLVLDEGYEYEGRVALAKGGGGGSQTTTVEPPAWQQPFMQNVLEQAHGQFQQGAPGFYPGSTVAAQDPAQIHGQDLAMQYAAGSATDIASQSEQGLGAMFQGANPLNNPFFSSTAEAMIRPATQQMTQQVLPGIRDQFAQAGQYGGSRQGVAEGRAIDSYQQNVLDALSRYGSSAYDSGQRTLGQAVALSPQVQQQGLLPAQIFQGVGQQQQDYQQSLIDADRARYDYNQQAPYDALNWYAGLVGNPMGQTQTSPGPQTNRVTQGLGGALTGATLGSMVPGLGAGATMLGPAGWAGMALGGALGLFG